MLLEQGKPAEALTEFAATLMKEPNRFRAVYGAAVAAQRAGDHATAKRYFAELLEICERADTGAGARSELVEARKASSS
jgi:Tfp pilus assembly protein PilF